MGSREEPANYLTTSSLTFAIPLSTIPSSLAAEPETSTTRPGMYGPRSLTRKRDVACWQFPTWPVQLMMSVPGEVGSQQTNAECVVMSTFRAKRDSGWARSNSC